MSKTENPAIPAHSAEALLRDIVQWGNTTTIIIHGGCVFEFKGCFPQGQSAEGFYNLKGESGFEGHLNLTRVAAIELQSKIHRGRESHAFVFVNNIQEVMFKIFLGRQENGDLIASQLEKFNLIKQQYQQVAENEE